MRDTEIGIAKDSLKLFGIVGSLRRVATGLDTTYRVKAANGQVFALRVSSGMPIRRVSAFRIEAEWIDALSGNRWFCVPQVQRTESGELIGKVEDAHGVVRASTLLSWLPGRRCYHPTLRLARTMGQLVGALHHHTQTCFAPPADGIKAWDARLMCLMPHNPKDGLFIVSPKAAELVQRIYEGLERTLATLNTHEIGLINADLGLHNVLWHEGQVSLVDFNDAGIGPYAFCLARLVAGIRQLENGQALVNELLHGYRVVTPLPSAYETWGDLFELAADTFRLNRGAARAVRSGTPLRESEQRIMDTLASRLDRLGL